MAKGSGGSGIHVIKANPDRLQIRKWMDNAGFTQRSLAAALSKRTKTTVDESQISRRIHGKNHFTTREIAELADLLHVPEQDALRAFGGIASHPVTGSIDDEGKVTLHVVSKEKDQVLEFKTTNALANATLAIKVCAKGVKQSKAGVYIVQATGRKELLLRQVVARIAGKWVVAPLFGEPKTEQVDELTFVAKAAHLTFA